MLTILYQNTCQSNAKCRVILGYRFCLSGSGRRGWGRSSPAVLTFLHTPMCQAPHMATNLQIDPELLEHALRVSGHRTKRETVTEALTEYIQHREQLRILDLFGTLDMDTEEEMRAQRKRS